VKGIILAGGTGSRLLPLTRVTNKHLLPVGNRPMILHAVEKLVEADVTDIIVITGTEHMGDMINLLGSGKEFGCEFTFRVQDNPDGIAGALRLCKNFVNGQPCIVVLGDNIFECNLKNKIADFNGGCRLFLKKVEDPQRYGVPTFDETGNIFDIEEKPQNPKSGYAVTGIYVYDAQLFDIIDKIKPSKRGEYEITDVNNFYIRKQLVSHAVLDGWWTDAGTHESYRFANQIITESKC
tara:strand:+ start:217 stop:927 length:711 start_codon:yes stop_codon:yes gene_type:complete